MTTHATQQTNDQHADHQNLRHRHYDAAIVGGRAAGAATAMLLARAGASVLVIDRQSYGSDTLSSHALMRGAVRRLANWGLLEAVMAETPLISRTSFSYGDETLNLDIRPESGSAGLAAPRRTVLDRILVDGAVAAGAEVLHDTKLNGLAVDNTGRVRGLDMIMADGIEAGVSADLVIGADGLRSSVARAVDAPITHQGQHAAAYAMRYYTDMADNPDIDKNAFRWLYRNNIGGGVIPTSGNAVCVFSAMTQDRFRDQARKNMTGTHQQILHELDPAVGRAVGRATPIGPIRSFPGVVGRFRQAVGPGWALVGDAGYFKDPFAAHGITDAFRDAELLTRAVLTDDFEGYEAARNELSMPLFNVLDHIASYAWDLESLKGLHYDLSKAMKAEDEATKRTMADLGSELALAA